MGQSALSCLHARAVSVSPLRDFLQRQLHMRYYFGSKPNFLVDMTPLIYSQFSHWHASELWWSDFCFSVFQTFVHLALGFFLEGDFSFSVSNALWFCIESQFLSGRDFTYYMQFSHLIWLIYGFGSKPNFKRIWFYQFLTVLPLAIHLNFGGLIMHFSHSAFQTFIYLAIVVF